MRFPDSALRETATKAMQIGSEWIVETPMRIHSGVSRDGSPDWHPEFARWLTRSDRPPVVGSTEAIRTTRAMRKLRRVSKREYEVCYRFLILRESARAITVWLNQRAIANAIPLPPGRSVHYVEKDAVALLMAGVDWAFHHR